MNFWTVGAEFASHVALRDGLSEAARYHLSTSPMHRDVIPAALPSSSSVSLMPVSELYGKDVLSVDMFSRATVFYRLCLRF